MYIALDYDNTYTNDPQTWDKIIDILELADHRVMCVTYRSPDIPVELPMKIPVYYTSWYAKRQYMLDLDISIDVWIDDWPEGILIGQGNPYEIKS